MLTTVLLVTLQAKAVRGRCERPMHIRINIRISYNIDNRAQSLLFSIVYGYSDARITMNSTDTLKQFIH